MADARTAAGLGAGAALAVDLLLLVPYAVADPLAVETYYGGDLVGPPLAGLFAAVGAIALLGGVRGRTDPPVAAGVALVLAALTAGLVVTWAVGVSAALVGGMTTVAAFEWHRWALAGAAVVSVVGAGGYARAVV